MDAQAILLIVVILVLCGLLVAQWMRRPTEPLDVGDLGGEPMERVAADLVRLPVVEQPKKGKGFPYPAGVPQWQTPGPAGFSPPPPPPPKPAPAKKRRRKPAAKKTAGQRRNEAESGR